MVTHQLQFAQQADRILAVNKDVSGMRMEPKMMEGICEAIATYTLRSQCIYFGIMYRQAL